MNVIVLAVRLFFIAFHKKKGRYFMKSNQLSCCSAVRTEAQPATVTPPSTITLLHKELITRIDKKEQLQAESMIYLSGGDFLMGTDDAEGFPGDGEGPIRTVELSPYYIDACTVTNEQFANFVRQTGYVTEAEKFGWSYVFHLFVPDKVREENAKPVPNVPWWLAVNGACWYRPEGGGSSIEERFDHPVVHVS